MRAAQLVEPGVFEVRDVSIPQPAAGEVLIRVAGAGLCGSDVHLVAMKERLFSLPMTLGHETAGWVEKIGEGVAGLELKQPVLIAGIWGCGRCRPCVEGHENACQYWATRMPVPLGPGLGFPGGMAEFMVAPARTLFPLGDLDPVEAAPLGDAGVTPCHAINLVRRHLRADVTVAVIGVGGLGHLALQLLRATTACRIVAVDNDAARLALAKGYGADETVLSDEHAVETFNQLTRGLGVEVVFDFVGASPTLTLANTIVATSGAVVVVGLAGGTMTVVADSPPHGLPKWGVELIRPYGATSRDIYEVIGLAQRKKLKADIERHPLDEAPAVLAALKAGKVKGRAVLIPPR